MNYSFPPPPISPIPKSSPLSRVHHFRTICGLIESATVHLTTADVDGLLSDVAEHCETLLAAREGTLPVADTIALADAMKKLLSGGSSTPLPKLPPQPIRPWFASRRLHPAKDKPAP